MQDADNKDFGLHEHGLRLDAQGHPHIAYGGSHLYYAWYDSISWQQEIVDNTLGVGGNASLALDAGGNPHIAYSGNNSVKYAHWTGSGWQILTIDSGGYSLSLALDNAGHPHIAYQKSINLMYAHWTGHTWLTQTLDLLTQVSLNTSLTLDSTTSPFIAYFKEGYSPSSSGSIKFAIGSWPGGSSFGPNYNRVAKPDEQMTYVHLLQNTGQASDTYTLTHHSSQSWSSVTGAVDGIPITLPASVTLLPGWITLITVTGIIPSSDSSEGFLDTTIITATSTVSPTFIRRVVDVTLVPTHESYLPIMLAEN